MPELLEVEVYRQAADRVVGREISAVDAPDAWYLKRGITAAALADVLLGRRFVATHRTGKLLCLDVAGGVVLGLRFGMTGRLIVDGDAPIDRLEYSSDRNETAWDRFAVGFTDGGSLRMRDPRRLGGVELDPALDDLGPDALELTGSQLRVALAGSSTALKARLMDQRRVAGLGNLLTDEILWRASLDPTRPAGSLDSPERRRLLHHLRRTLPVLAARGGSHTGDLQAERQPGGHCPRDGRELRRDQVGGRTTVWCPAHQR